MTILRVQDYGVIGDGETDGSVGLKAIRDHIRAGPDQVWHVDFEHGHYVYTDNTWWLFGDRQVVLHFNNSRIECISTHAWSRSFGLIATMSPFEFWDDGSFSQADAVLPPGTLIHSAAAGDADLSLITAMPDGPPAPGEVLLIGGFVQQTKEVDGEVVGHGWPANLRYFEYKTVAEVLSPTALRLVEPLRHHYDETWPNFVHEPLAGKIGMFGAPRVWRTSLPGYTMTRALHVKNAHFLGNRNKPVDLHGRTPCAFQSILNAELVRCTFAADTAPNCAFHRRIRYRDCRFHSTFEIDKLLERLTFDDCELMANLSGHGAGVLDLCLRDTLVHGRIEAIPRTTRFVNVYCGDRLLLGQGVDEAKEPFLVDGGVG